MNLVYCVDGSIFVVGPYFCYKWINREKLKWIILYITFQSKELRAICENMHNANEILGNKLASKLRSRLSDISVIDNILNLPVGSPEVDFEDGEECITITLEDDLKLGFVCGNTIQPKNQDNTINWSQVSRIRLVFIGDVK